MAEINTDCAGEHLAPVLNKKAMIIKTPATAATSDTIDVSLQALGAFKTIDWVGLLADDGTGGFLAATWSGTVITLPTITTGIHHLLVIGNAA